jgi:hypothetical protein
MLNACLELFELDFFELQFALEGLADEHVWRRPAPELLSVGELAGHIAHGFAARLSDQCPIYPPDVSKLPVQSPLIDSRFGYYPHQLESTPSEQQLSMTAEDVHQELLRVHREVVAHFKAWNPDLDSVPPGGSEGQTYREWLKYQTFHIAYHIGQMYSVRHLLGEATPDN